MPTDDYQRIEQAIHYLDANFRAQPDLAAVARHAGLSPFHFQRLFQRWAGVSPKRFVQFLSAGHARELLQQSRNVLDAAYETGLSSAGRLHDLTVSVHAATPGDIQRRGAGLTLRYGVHPTPFGDCLVALSERGICALAFTDGDADAALSDLRRQWPNATLKHAPQETRAVIERAFARPLTVIPTGIGILTDFPSPSGRGEGVRALIPTPSPGGRRGRADARSASTSFDRRGERAKRASRMLGKSGRGRARIELHPAGTNFQIKVWEALIRVPPGALLSYEQLARAIGAPQATRAVASAVARNPIAYLIPCHRVIRKTGAFGEYHWGETRKKAMLVWEAARYGEPSAASMAARQRR